MYLLFLCFFMNYLKRALEHCSARLSYEGKWLTFDVSTNCFEVWTKNYGHRNSRILITTESEEEAVNCLMEE